MLGRHTNERSQKGEQGKKFSWISFFLSCVSVYSPTWIVLQRNLVASPFMMDLKNICQIWGDKALVVPSATFYGAASCFGYKAFFRRMVRIDIDNGLLQCRGDRGCPIYKCRKCRYQKCILVGMKKELVPNEEECRKYAHPKELRGAFS